MCGLEGPSVGVQAKLGNFGAMIEATLCYMLRQ
jgi:hypothetical protein